MKKKNVEVQSRRDFFKKAAKATLPVIGFVVLNSMPIRIYAKTAATDCQEACVASCGRACTTCWLGCTGTCKGCEGKCEGGCKGGCRDHCNSNCDGFCDKGCKSGCGWQSEFRGW